GGGRVDVLAERDPPLEVPVFDLGLLVHLAGDARTGAAPGDGECALLDRELDRVGIDAGQLDDDDELGWILREEAVDGGTESAADSGEPRHLPEVGEELLDLPLQAVDVARGHRGDVTPRDTIERMPPVRRILKLIAAAFAFVLY